MLPWGPSHLLERPPCFNASLCCARDRCCARAARNAPCGVGYKKPPPPCPPATRPSLLLRLDALVLVRLLDSDLSSVKRVCRSDGPVGCAVSDVACVFVNVGARVQQSEQHILHAGINNTP